jgi:hypothetical protein
MPFADNPEAAVFACFRLPVSPGDWFMAAQLRVFSDTFDSPNVEAQEPSINISLAELLPILSLAKRNNYLWLQDFLEDEVRVTPDLYEVLRAFGTYRKGA